MRCPKPLAFCTVESLKRRPINLFTSNLGHRSMWSKWRGQSGRSTFSVEKAERSNPKTWWMLQLLHLFNNSFIWANELWFDIVKIWHSGIGPLDKRTFPFGVLCHETGGFCPLSINVATFFPEKSFRRNHQEKVVMALKCGLPTILFWVEIHPQKGYTTSKQNMFPTMLRGSWLANSTTKYWPTMV